MERLHPIVNFIYFAIVLGCGMVWMHPLCLVIGFVAALCYTIRLFGGRNARKGLLGMAGIMGIAAIMNPAFSHQGVTTLCYLPSGNALTLESIFYGMAAATMLGTTLMWFRCVSEIVTADKIVYLFGKPFPVLSMILCMVLGFIPKMQRKLQQIRYSQNVRGRQWDRGISGDSLGREEGRVWGKWETTRRLQRKVRTIRQGIRNISLLITWALQDAVDMADSMKGRGYGLPGRTAYTTFRFTKWDRCILAGIVLAFAYLVIGAMQGGMAWNYYPVTEGSGLHVYSVSLYIVYAGLCFLPVFIEWVEDRAYMQERTRML